MTKRTTRSAILLALGATSLLACTTYQMKYKDPSAQRGAKHEVKQKFFLWGHVGGDEVDLARLCPQGVAEITSESSFVDGMLFGLTGGLYAPRTVEVYCQNGTAAYRIDKTEEGVEVHAIAQRQDEE